MLVSARMGFWPFGKGKSGDDAGEVDFASRVVTASPRDGTTVRGKVTVHFTEPGSQARADEIAATCAKLAEEVLREAEDHEALLGEEAQVAAKVLTRLGNDERVRSLEVVALHVVGDVPSVAPKPPSIAPTRRPSSMPISRRPSSIPPVSAAPVSVRRPSSGQMLAVRAERIVPEHGSPEIVGKSLAPLLRDAATKLLIAVLRTYDLFVVRRLSVDDSPDHLDAIVPTSTAPLGFFADSRVEELDRWESALGLLKLEALRSETATLVCALLHKSLEHARIPTTSSTTILEKTSAGAFDASSSPLGEIGRYLHLADVSPMSELCESLVKILGHGEDLTRLELALTPVLASVQEDLSLAASQAQSSLGIRA